MSKDIKANGILTDKEIKELLRLAKDKSDLHWEIVSYMIATGKRLCETASSFQVTPRKIKSILYAHSKDLGRKVTPHSLRKSYACKLQTLGIHPRVIARLLGHRIEPFP